MKKIKKFFMITTVFIVSILFSTVNVYSKGINNTPQIKKNAKNINEFIPPGWKLNCKVEDDFNKDKLNDVALVIEQNFKYEIGDDNAPKRILLIAFRQKDKTYKLVKISSKAILKADEGGIWGDPFEGLSSKNGVLSIMFYGGSADRWGMEYKFRFQNNDWYLIGATIDNTNINEGNKEVKDYNLLTGKMITKKGFEGSKIVEKTINRGKKKLLKIDNFNPWVQADKDF